MLKKCLVSLVSLFAISISGCAMHKPENTGVVEIWPLFKFDKQVSKLNNGNQRVVSKGYLGWGLYMWDKENEYRADGAIRNGDEHYSSLFGYQQIYKTANQNSTVIEEQAHGNILILIDWDTEREVPIKNS